MSRAEDEPTLINQAQQCNRTAFGMLYAQYDKQIYGFIRGRSHDDPIAQEVAQKTREQVWRKMPTYDPARASFRTFTHYWAGIMLLRYYGEQRQQNKVEMLFSELQRRYAELAEEREIGDILAHVAAHQHPSHEQTRLAEEEAEAMVNAFEDLLRLTFGGTSPPHQLIAFGFRQLVQDGEPPEAWKPAKMVAELSDIPLRDLSQRLDEAYLKTSQLPRALVQSHFSPVRQSMTHPLREVLKAPLTRQTHTNLLDLIVGDTTLRQYYTHADHPTADISYWCESVRRRVWSAVKKEGNDILLRLLLAAERQKQEEQDTSTQQ